MGEYFKPEERIDFGRAVAYIGDGAEFEEVEAPEYEQRLYVRRVIGPPQLHGMDFVSWSGQPSAASSFERYQYIESSLYRHDSPASPLGEMGEGGGDRLTVSAGPLGLVCASLFAGLTALTLIFQETLIHPVLGLAGALLGIGFFFMAKVAALGSNA